MAVPSTSCIKISHTHTHTSNISCTTSRFIQGPQRPQPSIFKDYTDSINAALCQLLDRVQLWIFVEGIRNKTNSYFERDCAFFTFKWYNVGLEVNCRCYSSREGWHENVIIKAVSVSQGRRLTQNLTARLSRSVAVVDYLLPHFDTVHCLGYSLLNTAATATYFVGHCLLSLDTGDCSLSGVFCWTLSTQWGVVCWTHWHLSYILLNTLATANVFCWTQWQLWWICWTQATVHCLMYSVGHSLLAQVYFVEKAGNCYEFCWAHWQLLYTQLLAILRYISVDAVHSEVYFLGYCPLTGSDTPI